MNHISCIAHTAQVLTKAMVLEIFEKKIHLIFYLNVVFIPSGILEVCEVICQSCFYTEKLKMELNGSEVKIVGCL